MATTTHPSIGQLKRAVQIAEQIQKLEAELASLLRASGNAQSGAAIVVKGAKAKKAGGKRKRVMSPEAREKIAAAQRARWARQKKAK